MFMCLFLCICLVGLCMFMCLFLLNMSCWSVYVHVSLPMYISCWYVYVHVSLPSEYVLLVCVFSCVSSFCICLVGMCMFMCPFLCIYFVGLCMFMCLFLLNMSCWSVYVHVSLPSEYVLLVCVCSCVSSSVYVLLVCVCSCVSSF